MKIYEYDLESRCQICPKKVNVRYLLNNAYLCNICVKEKEGILSESATREALERARQRYLYRAEFETWLSTKKEISNCDLISTNQYIREYAQKNKKF